MPNDFTTLERKIKRIQYSIVGVALLFYLFGLGVATWLMRHA